MAGKTAFFAFLVMLIVAAGPVPAAERYGTTVICMYKSSDGYTRDNNPIKWYFEKVITSFGFTPEYFDMDTDIPNIGSLPRARAVLTFYNSSLVRDRNRGLNYIAFMNRALDAGCKLVIVNSFGAYGYGDAKNSKWDLIEEIKPLFLRMGFRFAGYWTNDPNKIVIRFRNSPMVEKEEKQNASLSRHYQRIIPLREDVISHLVLKRTDREKGIGDGESSVIMTSRNGGFALENYVVRGKKIMLDPGLFLKNSLFYDDGFQNIAVIVGEIRNRSRIIENLNYAFRYAKVEAVYLDEAVLGAMVAQDLACFESLVVAAESLDRYPVPLLEQYVRGGGSLLFIRYARLRGDMLALLGLKKYEFDKEQYFKDGFDLDGDFNINRMKLSCRKIGLKVRKGELGEGRPIARLLDAASGSGYPVAWVREIGGGKILYWNTDILFDEKGFRGTVIQSLHYLRKYFVTGMANVGMMMIDDLPQPLWNLNYKALRLKDYEDALKGEKDPEKIKELREWTANLKSYPDTTDTDFARNVWIKDIRDFQKELGFRYSAFLIFNYNKETGSGRGEFTTRDFYLADGNQSVAMGRYILASGWELGLHGYNHQSLTTKRPEFFASEPWSDKASMVSALGLVRGDWTGLYGDYTLPFTYVAPHNIIDASGREALAEVFPSLKVLSTVYIARHGETEQEFEWSADRRFYQIPRVTSGYMMSDEDKFFLFGVLSNFGVVSHFIHPDDPFDRERSGGYIGWYAMKAKFRKDFGDVKANFPWLRWMTVRDAYSELLYYDNTRVRVQKAGKVITVYSSDNSNRPVFLRFRAPKGQKILKFENCQLVSQNRESGDVVIRAYGYAAKMTLK